MPKFANLDLMRSFAVLLVMASHVMLYTRTTDSSHYSFWFIGLLGVFLFFTHTTLVLMWSLERDPHPLRFYIRRIFRIYPLWIVVLLLSIAIHLPTSPVFAPHFAFYHVGLKEFLENLTLTFHLGAGCQLIGASCSLPIELQMYIVLPFLFFFVRTYPRIWPLLLLDVLAIATSHHLESPLSESLLFCTPLFLPGVIAYVLYRRQRPKLPAWSFTIWLVFLAAAFNTWAAHGKNSFRSGWLLTLLLGLTLPLFRQIAWLPLRRVVHEVARYSYGVYLGHFAAIAIGVHYLQNHGLAIRVVAFLTTIVVLPAAFYHGVEKPMIQVGSWLAKFVEDGPEPPVDELTLSTEPAP